MANKTSNIMLRISEQEKEKVKQVATEKGMTVSEFILFLLRKEIYKEVEQ